MILLVGCGVFDFGALFLNAITGGWFSESGNQATREENMEDWLYQQSVLDYYQKGMVDYQIDKNKAYNKEMTLFQNDETKKMTQYMYDLYQSPTAKMNALKSAGVNPNLIAGSLAGTNIGATASSSSSMNASGGTAVAPGNRMNPQPVSLGNSLYQLEGLKMLKLKNQQQEIANMKDIADVMGEEYDESGNERSTIERFKAGLESIAHQKHQLRRMNFLFKQQQFRTLIAEEVLGELEALDDTSSFKEMQKKGIKPYLIEALNLAAEGDILGFEREIAKLRKKGAEREDAWDESLKHFVTMDYNFPKELKWAEPVIKYGLRILMSEQMGSSVVSGMLPGRRTNKLVKTRRRMSENIGGIKYQREDIDYY